MTFSASIQLQAQTDKLIGLWVVEKVAAAGQEMTPVARWFRINENGTFESGNGWTQWSEGDWTYDDSTKQFLPEEKNDIKDPSGAFTVSFAGEKMLWKREEEGMAVTITLSLSEKLPEAPADKIQGWWDLEKAESNGLSNMEDIDPEDRYILKIRWDRIFEEWKAEGSRATGYWHMHAKRPHLTLLPHTEGESPSSWIVEFNGSDEVILTGISDHNRDQKLIFSRLYEYPQ